MRNKANINLKKAMKSKAAQHREAGFFKRLFSFHVKRAATLKENPLPYTRPRVTELYAMIHLTH